MPMIFVAADHPGAAQQIKEHGLDCWMRGKDLKNAPPSEPVGLTLVSAGTYNPAWLTTHEMYRVRYAIGPTVASHGDWARFGIFYRDLHTRCSGSAIVRVLDPSLIDEVPVRYPVAPECGPRFDPWSLIGRRVWIQGTSSVREAWEVYCELQVVGADVVGIVLPSISFTCLRKRVVSADLRVRLSDWNEGELRFKRSLANIRDFWKAATALYDGKTTIHQTPGQLG
ncbi:MAG: hypothetical protein ACYC63_04750 [Armatimonadota bacterium]